jgi:type IV pilus assembly protein PilC
MRFTYKARTQEGKIQRGTVEASSRKAALDILEKYGLYATALKEEGKGGFLGKEISFGMGISQKDLVIFTRQFGVMLKSAIPPVEALKAQVAQTPNPSFREKILRMAEAVETGASLSQAFSLYPKIFDPFYVSIIKSGEATGKVADALNYLADHLEREYNLHQKIRGAMIYPAFVVIVFIAAFFLVTFFIVPKLTDILKGFTGKLPLSTRLMISLSDFVRKGGWVLILGLLGVLFLLPLFMKHSKKTNKFYDKISLKIPILGDFYKRIYLTRFSQNLSVLISAGLPITQALKITKDIIDNSVYKEIIKEAEERVARGERISAVFSEHPEQIPPFVTQMISTGEDTGRLEQTLMDIVHFYRQEIERTTANLTTILEPVLILTLGIGIAVLAVSVFIPLFKIGMGGFGGGM